MSEIGTTNSSTWPVNRVVPPTSDAQHSPKRQKKKQSKNNQSKDIVNEDNVNPKKKPPGSGLNTHIDEYA